MHTFVNCQHHLHPSLHLSIFVIRHKDVGTNLLTHSTDLYESWKFWSSVSEVVIAYVRVLINKSLKLLLFICEWSGVVALEGLCISRCQ